MKGQPTESGPDKIVVEQYNGIGAIYLFSQGCRILSLRLEGKGYDSKSRRIKKFARKLLAKSR